MEIREWVLELFKRELECSKAIWGHYQEAQICDGFYFEKAYRSQESYLKATTTQLTNIDLLKELHDMRRRNFALSDALNKLTIENYLLHKKHDKIFGHEEEMRKETLKLYKPVLPLVLKAIENGESFDI